MNTEKRYSDYRRILSVLSVTTLAAFMTGFNARLTVVGIPNIGRSLGADIQQILWITQGYMVGSVFMQPLIGRLSDLYGRVRLFNLGLLLFTLGALGAGISRSVYMVIASRILQGIGAAPLMTLSVTILTDNVPRERLATWLGVNQVSWRAGAIIGMTIAGVIIDRLGWQWLFLVQVPIGFAVYLWSRRTLVDIYRPVEKPVMDVPGFALFVTSITSVLLGLTYASYGQRYRLLSWILISIAISTLIALIFWERRAYSPVLDLALFRIWGFTSGIVAQMLYSIAFGASLTLLSLYFQVVRGFSAEQTGFLLVPFELGFLVAGLVGGRAGDRYGYAPITILGLLSASAALYMLSTYTSTSSQINYVALAITILGIGAGLFTGPNTSSIMASVPPHRRGIASSLRTITFNIGFAASLNIAILNMALVIPYDIASKLIAEQIPNEMYNDTLTEISRMATAIATSFRVQAAIMAIAIAFSITRLERQRSRT